MKMDKTTEHLDFRDGAIETSFQRFDGIIAKIRILTADVTSM